MSDGRVVIDSTLNDEGVERGIKRMKAKLSKLADMFGDVGKAAAGITLSPALIPALAAATAAAGGLASSLAAAGGALGAFGVAAIGNAKKLGEHMSDIQSINEKIKAEKQSLDPDQEKINELLNQRSNILGTMSDAEQLAMKQVNQFKDAWKDFLKMTEQPVFEVFADGLMLAKSLLWEIRIIIDPVSDALSDLLRTMNDFSKTEQFASFMQFFANEGAQALKRWGNIAGNIFVGVMELLMAFSPLAEKMTGGILDMSKAFRDWAESLAGSDAFKAFVSYVKENGKIFLDTLGNVAAIVGNIVQALAPLGGASLKVVKDLSALFAAFARGDTAVEGLVQSLTQHLSEFIEMGANMAISIIQGLAQVMPQLVQAAVNIILKLITTINQHLPTLLKAGGKILTALLNGIMLLVPQLLPLVVQLVNAFVKFIKQNLPAIIAMGMKITRVLAQAIFKAVPQLVLVIIKLMQAVIHEVAKHKPEMIQMGKELLFALIDGIEKVLPDLIPAVIDIIFAMQKAFDDNKWKIIGAGMKVLGKIIWGMIKAIPQALYKIGHKILPLVIDAFTPDEFLELGKKLIGKLIDGFTSLDLPTPHFSVTGGLDINPIGGMSFPDVDVSWYKDGAVFPANSPRLVGMGDASVKEAALPLKPSVLGMIGQKIADTMDGDGGGTYVFHNTFEIDGEKVSEKTFEYDMVNMQEAFEQRGRG